MRQMAQITADELLAAARAEIGTKEQPQNSNRVKYNTAFYGREVSGAAYPWCVTFIWWLFWKLGAAELFCGGQKSTSCGVVMDYAKKHSQFHCGVPPFAGALRADLHGVAAPPFVMEGS